MEIDEDYDVWTNDDWDAFDKAMEEESDMVLSTLDDYVKCAKYEHYDSIEMAFQQMGVFPDVVRCMNAAKNKKRMASVLLNMSKITLGCGVINKRRYSEVLDTLKKWKAEYDLKVK